MQPPQSLTAAVKTSATEEGFAAVGVVAIDADLKPERFDRWLTGGFHAEMAYMARHRSMRHHPGELLGGAKSVICLAVGYAPLTEVPGDVFVARYARGRDYHRVLKKRCHGLMDRLREIEPTFEGRAFVDTGPLSERALAAAAGVGWIGRNGCLIVPELGSYMVLAEIVCNLPLTLDQPLSAGCNDCDACVRACPTGALTGDGLLDARRCRSYLTIEHGGKIAAQFWPKMDACLFGCDTCQTVCPHNRNVPAGDDQLATPREAVRALTLADVLGWSECDWDSATRGSTMRRATYEMFLRNAVLAAGSSGDRQHIPALERAGKSYPSLTDAARWAIARLGQS
ncbi:MAG: tRNA epoxyqueuosine(34) reductase QueG [Planctomycetota bacterium]|jgi:epoxyqueuosine reductase